MPTDKENKERGINTPLDIRFRDYPADFDPGKILLAVSKAVGFYTYVLRDHPRSRLKRRLRQCYGAVELHYPNGRSTTIYAPRRDDGTYEKGRDVSVSLVAKKVYTKLGDVKAAARLLLALKGDGEIPDMPMTQLRPSLRNFFSKTQLEELRSLIEFKPSATEGIEEETAVPAEQHEEEQAPS